MPLNEKVRLHFRPEENPPPVSYIDAELNPHLVIGVYDRAIGNLLALASNVGGLRKVGSMFVVGSYSPEGIAFNYLVSEPIIKGLEKYDWKMFKACLEDEV